MILTGYGLGSMWVIRRTTYTDLKKEGHKHEERQ